MVGITLCAIDEDAFHAVQNTLDRLAHHARPVGADLVAADGVGMALEVDDGDGVAPFAVDAHKLHHLVRRPDGSDDVFVASPGVRAAGAVLHAVAADEGDVLGLAARDGELSRRQVGKRELHGVLQAFAHESLVRAGLGEGVERRSVVAQAHMRPRVRMSAGYEHSLRRKPGCCGGVLAEKVEVRAKVDYVGGDDDRLVGAIRKRDSIDVERVNDPVRHALPRIAGKLSSNRRRHVDAGKARLEFSVKDKACARGRHCKQYFCFHFNCSFRLSEDSKML